MPISDIHIPEAAEPVKAKTLLDLPKDMRDVLLGQLQPQAQYQLAIALPHQKSAKDSPQAVESSAAAAAGAASDAPAEPRQKSAENSPAIGLVPLGMIFRTPAAQAAESSAASAAASAAASVASGAAASATSSTASAAAAASVPTETNSVLPFGDAIAFNAGFVSDFLDQLQLPDLDLNLYEEATRWNKSTVSPDDKALFWKQLRCIKHIVILVKCMQSSPEYFVIDATNSKDIMRLTFAYYLPLMIAHLNAAAAVESFPIHVNEVLQFLRQFYHQNIYLIAHQEATSKAHQKTMSRFIPSTIHGAFLKAMQADFALKSDYDLPVQEGSIDKRQKELEGLVSGSYTSRGEYSKSFIPLTKDAVNNGYLMNYRFYWCWLEALVKYQADFQPNNPKTLAKVIMAQAYGAPLRFQYKILYQAVLVVDQRSLFDSRFTQIIVRPLFDPRASSSNLYSKIPDDVRIELLLGLLSGISTLESRRSEILYDRFSFWMNQNQPICKTKEDLLYVYDRLPKLSRWNFLDVLPKDLNALITLIRERPGALEFFFNSDWFRYYYSSAELKDEIYAALEKLLGNTKDSVNFRKRIPPDVVADFRVQVLLVIANKIKLGDWSHVDFCNTELQKLVVLNHEALPAMLEILHDNYRDSSRGPMKTIMKAMVAKIVADTGAEKNQDFWVQRLQESTHFVQLVIEEPSFQGQQLLDLLLAAKLDYKQINSLVSYKSYYTINDYVLYRLVYNQVIRTKANPERLEKWLNLNILRYNKDLIAYLPESAYNNLGNSAHLVSGFPNLLERVPEPVTANVDFWQRVLEKQPQLFERAPASIRANNNYLLRFATTNAGVVYHIFNKNQFSAEDIFLFDNIRKHYQHFPQDIIPYSLPVSFENYLSSRELEQSARLLPAGAAAGGAFAAAASLAASNPTDTPQPAVAEEEEEEEVAEAEEATPTPSAAAGASLFPVGPKKRGKSEVSDPEDDDEAADEAGSDLSQSPLGKVARRG